MERPDQKRKNTFARLASVFTLVGTLCCLASLIVRSFLASLPSYVQEDPYAASVMASTVAPRSLAKRTAFTVRLE